jgi:FAS-associated factor 2
MFWGGDVCTSRDAHVAATILQAATFPFVAFLSMQPTPPSRLTGSSPPSSSSSKMTVFSRLEGLQTTSIQQITSHITETMAPRLNPFLGRLRAQKREREAQRSLREEQDRAYEEAGKRDLERVRAKEAELRAKRAEEQAKKDEEDQARTQQEAKAREGLNRQAWRRKTALEFGPEPTEGTKLVIRLPDGRRLMRRFRDDEHAMRIWYYIECEAFDVHVNDSTVSISSTGGSTTNYTPDITFSLATTFPRRLLKPDAAKNKTVGDLVSEGLLEKKVASVIVEGLKLKQDDAGTDEEIEEEEEEED